MTSAGSTAGSTPPADSRIPVLGLGRSAQAILRDNRHGDVIAVFRRSFYVRLGDAVICLGSGGLGRGPLNVLCRMPDDLSWCDRLANRAAVTREGSILMVGDHLRFDYGDAPTWHAPVAAAVSVGAIRSGLGRLAEAARRRSPGGLGPLLMSPAAATSWLPVDDADLLLHSAASVTGPLGEWFAAALAGSPQPPPATEPLIGLGPGLTPSGDDFLCGAMAALHYLGRGEVARRLAERVLPAAQSGTSLISACYLRCAAQGEASEVLFNALGCVVAGGDSDLDTHLDAVDAVGHTSGWDSLAGAAAVCAALCAGRAGARGS